MNNIEKSQLIRELLDAGQNVSQIATAIRCSRNTVKKVRDGVPVRVDKAAPQPSQRYRRARSKPKPKPKPKPEPVEEWVPTPSQIAASCLAIRLAKGEHLPDDIRRTYIC